MAVICTLFSVTDADIAEVPTEMSLPSISDRTSRVSGAMSRPHVCELGETWLPLHLAFGEHPPEHALGFLAAGGQPFAALDGAGSAGRFFGPHATVKMLASVARVTDDHLMRNIAKRQLVVPAVAELIRHMTKLRVFLAEAVSGDRGVIVHHIG